MKGKQPKIKMKLTNMYCSLLRPKIWGGAAPLARSETPGQPAPAGRRELADCPLCVPVPAQCPAVLQPLLPERASALC